MPQYNALSPGGNYFDESGNFRGVDNFHAIMDIDGGHVLVADNLIMKTGIFWIRPGYKALFAQTGTSSLSQITGYPAYGLGVLYNTGIPYVIFTSGGKIYSTLAYSNIWVELLDENGSSYTVNSSSCYATEPIDGFVYICDGKSPFKRLSLAGGTPVYALGAPTSSPVASVVDQFIDNLTDGTWTYDGNNGTALSQFAYNYGDTSDTYGQLYVNFNSNSINLSQPIVILTGGSGYVIGDQITLNSGTISAVVQVIAEANGKVTSIGVVNIGAYSTAPTIFNQSSTTGSGTGASFEIATKVSNIGWQAFQNYGNSHVSGLNAINVIDTGNVSQTNNGTGSAGAGGLVQVPPLYGNPLVHPKRFEVTLKGIKFQQNNYGLNVYVSAYDQNGAFIGVPSDFDNTSGFSFDPSGTGPFLLDVIADFSAFSSDMHIFV